MNGVPRSGQQACTEHLLCVRFHGTPHGCPPSPAGRPFPPLLLLLRPCPCWLRGDQCSHYLWSEQSSRWLLLLGEQTVPPAFPRTLCRGPHSRQTPWSCSPGDGSSGPEVVLPHCGPPTGRCAVASRPVGPVHATSSVTLGRCSATGRAQPCTQGAQGSHTCHIRHFQALPTR